MMEKNVGGFDIPMDDTEGVQVCETREEAMENGDDLFLREGGMVSRCIPEKRVEIDRQKGEDEGEFTASEGEGIKQGDDGSVLCCGENACFAQRIVWRATLGWNGNFKGKGGLA